MRARDVRMYDSAMQFVLDRSHDKLPALDVRLNLVGMHAVQNALAAIAVAGELNIADEIIVRALHDFRGVSRRFESYGEVPCVGGTFTLIDDYGHHPTEIQAVLSAVRLTFPQRRILLAFQPHRYSRTQDCFEEFVAVLRSVDVLLLSEIYSAGEPRLAGISAQALLEDISYRTDIQAILVPSTEDMPSYISHWVRAHDVVLVMGAGSIASVAMQTKAMQLGLHGGG